MSPELQELHKLLLQQHAALAKKLEKETDPATARAVLVEMQEILHRTQLTQGLLFREQAAGLKEFLGPIRKASADLSALLKRREKLNRFLSGASRFLRTVDDLLDFAKKALR